MQFPSWILNIHALSLLKTPFQLNLSNGFFCYIHWNPRNVRPTFTNETETRETNPRHRIKRKTDSRQKIWTLEHHRLLSFWCFRHICGGCYVRLFASFLSFGFFGTSTEPWRKSTNQNFREQINPKFNVWRHKCNFLRGFETSTLSHYWRQLSNWFFQTQENMNLGAP